MIIDNKTLTILQVIPHPYQTHPTVSLILIKWSHLSVILDPILYMIYQKKYREAIKDVFGSIGDWCNEPVK